jgi:peroxiredoxin
VWEAYGGDVMVLVAAPDDELEYVQAFRDELGLTMPVLHDEGGRVHTAWEVDRAYEDTFYPQDYLIDADGHVVYVSNTYEPERIEEILDSLLSP